MYKISDQEVVKVVNVKTDITWKFIDQLICSSISKILIFDNWISSSVSKTFIYLDTKLQWKCISEAV